MVYTQTGKGTFVASCQKIDQNLETLTSFTEDMATQGKKVTSRVIKMGIELAEEFEANKLKISPSTGLFLLERFRLVDDEIISLECTFIPMLYVRILKNAMIFRKNHSNRFYGKNTFFSCLLLNRRLKHDDQLRKK